MEAANNRYNITTQTEVPAIRYNDLYFRLIACLIGAHVLIMMGENFSSLQAFAMWSYYPTLAINYVIALVLAQVVKSITIKLDRKYPWEDSFWVRLALQFCAGVVAVSLLSFFLVLLYFEGFNQDIMKSSYPKYEFPFSIALLTLLNTYYVLYYFYHRVQILAGNRTTGFVPGSYKEVLSVNEGNTTISLSVTEIAYIFILENVVLVRSTAQKDYITSYTLDELETTLDPHIFFRINRKLIANRSACKSYQPQGYGLEVQVDPTPPVPASISQRKVTKFKGWWTVKEN